MNGPIHEVMSRLVKAVTARKITIPGSFKRYLQTIYVLYFSQACNILYICVSAMDHLAQYHAVIKLAAVSFIRLNEVLCLSQNLRSTFVLMKSPALILLVFKVAAEHRADLSILKLNIKTEALSPLAVLISMFNIFYSLKETSQIKISSLT